MPVRPQPVQRRGIWIHWEADHRTVKLNTDGSLTSSGSTGGGVIRDSKGDLIVGFGAPYHHHSC